MTMFVLNPEIHIFDPWGWKLGVGEQDRLVWLNPWCGYSAYLVSIMEMQFADDDS